MRPLRKPSEGTCRASHRAHKAPFLKTLLRHQRFNRSQPVPKTDAMILTKYCEVTIVTIVDFFISLNRPTLNSSEAAMIQKEDRVMDTVLRGPSHGDDLSTKAAAERKSILHRALHHFPHAQAQNQALFTGVNLFLARLMALITRLRQINLRKQCANTACSGWQDKIYFIKSSFDRIVHSGQSNTL